MAAKSSKGGETSAAQPSWQRGLHMSLEHRRDALLIWEDLLLLLGTATALVIPKEKLDPYVSSSGVGSDIHRSRCAPHKNVLNATKSVLER